MRDSSCDGGESSESSRQSGSSVTVSGTRSTSAEEESDSDSQPESTSESSPESASEGSSLAGSDSSTEASLDPGATSDSSSSGDAPKKFWECCCSQTSRLTAAGLACGLRGKRLTLPECDFTVEECVQEALGEAAADPPDFLWISIPCTAYSPFQNLRRGRSSRKSVLSLQRKRAHTNRMARNCFRVAKRVVRRRKKFYYENLGCACQLFNKGFFAVVEK